MLLSVFTPSHNPQHLPALYKCLLNQTHTQWEWVIVANGIDATNVTTAVNTLTNKDPRVHCVRYQSSKIGDLKHFACRQAKGDVFVEVDHDDLITPDCLEEVAKAAQDRPHAFIYSDDVNLHEDGKCSTYTPAFGWKTYPCTMFDIPMTAHHTFKPTPRSLCEILFAPDHVRAWTRQAYDKAGGHNVSMDVADDHELIVRTYLSGADFVHIPKSLYAHRMWNNQQNTSVAKVEKIQRISHQTRDKHLYNLVEEWCRRENYVILDMAMAEYSAPKYLSVYKRGPADFVVDTVVDGFETISKQLKDTGRKVGAIRAFNFLQSIPSASVHNWFNAAWKLLEPNGWLLTATPAICDNDGRASKGAWQDPSNVSAWSNNNFWYITDNNYARFCPEVRCRFQAARNFVEYPSEFHRHNLIPYVYADLVALKGDMEIPGPVLI